MPDSSHPRGLPIRQMSMDAAPTSIDDLLGHATAAGASDLHLVPGAPPMMRVHGDLAPLPSAEKVMPDDTRTLLYRILSTEQQKQLEVNGSSTSRTAFPASRAFA